MLAARITLPHFSVSTATSLAKSAGDPGSTVPPKVCKPRFDLRIGESIGVRLLDRTSKGVEATAYGRALLRRGMGAFDELRQGIKDIESLADPTVGEVRVGCPEAIADGLLLPFINE
jgi:hypothetical protein